MSDWIDIKKQEPPYNRRVLVYCPELAKPDGLIDLALTFDRHERGLIWTCRLLDGEVTHWMPLPGAPEVENGK